MSCDFIISQSFQGKVKHKRKNGYTKRQKRLQEMLILVKYFQSCTLISLLMEKEVPITTSQLKIDIVTFFSDVLAQKVLF